MKRTIILFSFCALLVFGLTASAFSADGAALYKRCASCHGADGSKAPNTINGQSSAQLLEKLKGYAAGTFGGEKKAVMTSLVKGLSAEDMQALADYIAKF